MSDARVPVPALLTDDELRAGPDAWRDLPDPLPAWADLHRHPESVGG